MSQIKSNKLHNDNINFSNYKNKYLNNKKIEYLIERGNVGQIAFFKGETGDRYSIYVFTKRSKDVVEVSKIWNQYGHGTDEGVRIAVIRKGVIEYNSGEFRAQSWVRYETAENIKQLSRQGIFNTNSPLKVNYVRSDYVLRIPKHDIKLCPWEGIKINLKTGKVVQKAPKHAINKLNTIMNQDKAQRKRNYIANKENTNALKRYRDAGGDTELARVWNPDEAAIALNMSKMDWSKIPMDDVFRHRNATLRSNIIEHYGMNAIMETLDYDVVDVNTIDSRYYRLLNVLIPDFSGASRGFNEPEEYRGLYLEMINPSTGESHFEGVANVGNNSWEHGLKEATVLAALAWRDNDASSQTTNNWSSDRPDSETYVKPVILK